MTDWPFDKNPLPPGYPKKCNWEVFMRNDDGEWESIASFETQKEATKHVDALVRSGDLSYGELSVEYVGPAE